MYEDLLFNYKSVEFNFLIDKNEEIISESIKENQVWESNQLDLYEYYVEPTGVFVDIGANVGINSIFLKKIRPNARTLAIEASTENYKLLLRNTEGVGIEVHHLAIADFDGSIPFAGSGTRAHISTAGAPGSISVPAKRLDSFVLENNISSIDLVKIDVEGFTDVVLAGAKETLSIASSLIVEFSIVDVSERFECDRSGVQKHFQSLIEQFNPTHPNMAYISRRDGLVRFDDTSDLMEMLALELDVGDVLFTRERAEGSMSVNGFIFRRLHELMHQNHLRILEISDLRKL